MALMERQRQRSDRETRKQTRIFRRRRRRLGFYVFSALVVLALGGVAFAAIGPELRGERGTVGQVEPPQRVEAPDAVSENPAQRAEEADRAAEEREAREQARAEEEAAAEREAAAAEEEAAEEEASALDAPDPATTDLYLTVPKMGLSGDYVANDASEATLYNGAGKITSTGFPWQEGANTYIASHVLGYQGTGSYMHFAALPSMTYGDEFYLTDANGTEYKYVVNEILTVPITDVWVTDPVPGRSMVSLQTCINPPAYDLRLVVRGDLVSVTEA